MVPEDLDRIYALDSNPEVHRYRGNNSISDRTQLAGVIEKVLAQYRDHGIGGWSVIEKETNSFTGWSGLKYVGEEVNGRHDFYNLGYRLFRRARGKGYATESAKAALEFGFKTLQLLEILPRCLQRTKLPMGYCNNTDSGFWKRFRKMRNCRIALLVRTRKQRFYNPGEMSRFIPA